MGQGGTTAGTAVSVSVFPFLSIGPLLMFSLFPSLSIPQAEGTALAAPTAAIAAITTWSGATITHGVRGAVISKIRPGRT